ncbi:unnamed protein product [[Candida] boidinii]|uniref:Unnamed protein product n=1 Tax=Candida boidinii TaxID=5477 RepID=A0A9W6SV28_CANBO|nr:catalytic activity protein [[Candida] boidinii]GME67412.1 unnamed protein product [[Candida] boidinii]GMG00315.1 unnamed protein product [[Candida] boidinii]
MKVSSRVLKEVKNFKNTDDLKLVTFSKTDSAMTDDLSTLYIDMKIIHNELYPANDVYRLQIIVNSEYPFKAPQVQFVKYGINDKNKSKSYKIPIHPHIYSNGHICLNILYDGWTPAITLHAIGLSIQSMLTGNKKYEKPEGDAKYCAVAPQNPLKSRWLFEDDTV